MSTLLERATWQDYGTGDDVAIGNVEQPVYAIMFDALTAGHYLNGVSAGKAWPSAPSSHFRTANCG